MKFLLIFSLILLSGLQSCKTVSSQVNCKSSKFDWLFVSQIEDKIQFEYKSLSNGVAGKKEYKGIGVKMKLPAGLVHNSITDNNMTFYYKDNQLIFIKTLYADDTKYTDTLYVLDRSMAEAFIDDSVPTFPEEKELRDTKFLKNRKTLIVKRGRILVFLYNIKRNRYNEFRNSALEVVEY